MSFHPSCSLCSRFDANKEFCTLYETKVSGMEQSMPLVCKSKGSYIRDLNVLLDSYHFYGKNEHVPSDFKVDMSRLPKDERGTPLFVLTKRGIERAIPAYSGLDLKGDMLLGVSRIMTYQGQRELIHDLGVEMATSIAEAKGIELIVLEGEKESKGIPEEIRRHKMYQNKRHTPNPWVKTEEGEW